MNDQINPALGRAIERLAPAFAADAPDHERRGSLSQGLVELVAAVTDRPAETIQPDAPLMLESIHAAQVQAVLDAAFGVNLPLAEMLGEIGVPELADYLITGFSSPADEADKTEPGRANLYDLVAEPELRYEPFPLTDVQQAYLLGREPAYELGNVDAAFYAELSTVDLDIDRFEQALRDVIASHDMLRAIVLDEGTQRVLQQVPDYSIGREDLTALSQDERQARLEAMRTEMSSQQRAVDTWPLFDIRVTTHDARRGRIHIAIDLLVCDGASFTHLLQELAARYEDTGGEWTEPQLTFRDYQRTAERVESGVRYERAKQYWMDRLPELAPAPELPYAKPLSAIETPRFHRRHNSVPEATWQALKDQANKHGVTTSATLAAAYSEVLRSWSRTQRFSMNMTVNNRLPVHEQVRDVVGDFTTLNVLEVRTDSQAPFADRAKALQEQLWRDLDHREFGGVRVMRELARRTGPASAVMPVVFSTLVGAGLPEDFDPDWLEGLDYTLARAPQLALECLVYEYRGGLSVTWDTVDEAFAPGVLNEMFAAYNALIDRLAHTDAAWDDIDTPLTPAGQLEVREQVNQTDGIVPDALLHRLGSALSDRWEAPAVITADRVLTYADLDRLACRIGRRLRKSGARPNRLVAVVMDKGWEQVAAVLGTLYAGAAYLPIDASLPPDRIRRLLELGEADLVLTQRARLDDLPWPDQVTAFAVDNPETWAGQDDAPLDDVQEAADLAYVIFTSGSTGEPKGVMIDHRGAANTVHDINSRFRIGAWDRVLGLSSLSFDLSVWDIFGILAAGGAIVLPEPDAGRDPERWAELVTEHKVTVWNTVPALMQMYVLYGESRSDLNALEPLRLILMSGDWIDITLPDRIKALAGPVDVISLGGATEASIWSIFHPINGRDPAWTSVPYGTPLTNQTFHVLDDRLRPSPDWVTGHLYIGGVGLAQGYWRDPEKTARRFITCPHTGRRLYDTGDLGRYHPDGTIEFLGREDHQVKVNGYRIELGEIEHILASHPAVGQVVATADGNRLAAFVTTDDSRGAAESLAEAQVEEWQDVFDSLREPVGATGSDFDTTGWTDSFTEQPIPDEDMREWVDVTLRRVLAHRPRRVLEIGCGTGLIASRLVRECDEYVGTDLSEATLDNLRRHIADSDRVRADVTLLRREGRDLTGIRDTHYDCVVINSVVQYFPSVDYLADTVTAALAKLRPGGFVYIGDVRDLRVLRAFHTAVELNRARLDGRIADLAWRVNERDQRENELVVHPALFWNGNSYDAAVLPRPGAGTTEMADYRYDVLIFQNAEKEVGPYAIVPWSGREHTFAEIQRILDDGPRSLTVRDVPNRRLRRDLAWAAEVREPANGALAPAELVDRIEAGHDPADSGVMPGELLDMAHRHGYTCEFFYRPDAPAASYTAVFLRDAALLPVAMRACAYTQAEAAGPLTNDPLAGRWREMLPGEIRAHAARQLPDYMVPADIMVLPALPLTANGKVDMGRLRAVAGRRPERADRTAEAPRNAVEQTLAEVWRSLLGVDEVSVHDDFFQCGGDSLSAVRLVSAARRAGLGLRVDHVFAEPTIAGLAELADQSADDGDGDGLPVVTPAPEQRFEPFGLTDIQQAYLLGRNGFFPLGNVPAAFYVELSADDADLDAERLTAALRAMVARHDMLRAVITTDNRWQVRRDVPACEVAVGDLRHLSADQAEIWLDEIRAEMTTRIFDPRQWPLFEVRVTRLADGTARLHVTLDLLVADGVTVALFFAELAARHADPNRVWPDLELSFRDYQMAIEQAEADPRYERAREYWTGRAADLPAAPGLPLAAAPAEIAEPHFVRRSHRVAAEDWALVKLEAARRGVTPTTALAAAYAEVLGGWSRSPRFTLNVTVNNRLPVHDQITDVIGDFTAVTLLEVDADPQASFADRAKAMQERLWRDLDHSEFGGVRVMREIARVHGADRASMPVVFTSALDSGAADLGSSVGRLGEMVTGIVHTPQVYLDHQVFEDRGALVLNWDAVEEILPPDVLDEMFAAYCRLVERLAGSEQAWEATPVVLPPQEHPPYRPIERIDAQGICSAEAVEAAMNNTATAPDEDTERLLTEIWSEVLGVDTIGLHDDFAALGGDSLLALQAINKAASAGLTIAPRDFFADPTIAGLAAVTRRAGPATPAVPDGHHGEYDGQVALLPRQIAFLEEYENPQRHNYVLMFDLPEPLERSGLRVALRTVLRHHDGLRISFQYDHGWGARVHPYEELDIPLTWVNLADTPNGEKESVIRETSLRLQESIRLDRPPLFHVAYFQGEEQDRLFIVGNQLMWDNYSVRVFLEDLLSAHWQIVEHGEAVLPPADSIATWAAHEESLAADPDLAGERTHWRRLAESTPATLSVDYADPGGGPISGTEATALNAEATAALRKKADELDLAVPDFLLGAVARTLTTFAGQDVVRIDVDGHGRDRDSAPADPARIVGRLSNRWPLEIPASAGTSLLQAARTVTTARRLTPEGGRNYDLLAYLTAEPDLDLRAARSPMLFNYLGRAEALWDSLGLDLSDDHPGLAPTGGSRGYQLEFLAGIVNDQILVACAYDAASHDESTISVLLEEIRRGIETELLGAATPPALPSGADTLLRWISPA